MSTAKLQPTLRFVAEIQWVKIIHTHDQTTVAQFGQLSGLEYSIVDINDLIASVAPPPPGFTQNPTACIVIAMSLTIA